MTTKVGQCDYHLVQWDRGALWSRYSRTPRLSSPQPRQGRQWGQLSPTFLCKNRADSWSGDSKSRLQIMASTETYQTGRCSWKLFCDCSPDSYYSLQTITGVNWHFQSIFPEEGMWHLLASKYGDFHMSVVSFLIFMSGELHTSLAHFRR